jgi:hypothetical protein
MINILVLLIIAGCAIAVFYKLNVTSALTAVIAAVCTVMVAFNFVESAASIAGFLGGWSKTFCFLLLSVLPFGLLLSAIKYLVKNPVNLDLLTERIGRVIFGLILGVFLSGFLLVACAMSPLPAKYPYNRFDRADQSSPNKLILNVDGFVTGLFTTLSDGSFSGGKSFDRNYLDKLYKDRLNQSADSQVKNETPSNQQNLGGRQGGRGGRGNRGQGMTRGIPNENNQDTGSQE